MAKRKKQLTAVDLFAGAGGLSLGFEEAGFKVLFAVENDKYSSETYKRNRKGKSTEVIVSDISNVDFCEVLKKHKLKNGEVDVLLAGPPCQGFSSSNMRTRNSENPQNHLFREFLRGVSIIYPKWLVFENVAGFLSFEEGKVIEILTKTLRELGYYCNWETINANDFGVPQTRKRFFLVGNRISCEYPFPFRALKYINNDHLTVFDAISDLPVLQNGNRVDSLPYRYSGNRLTLFQQMIRSDWEGKYCLNNLVSLNNKTVLKRYKYIPCGGNWKDIPKYLMNNYKKITNCHSGIYWRLSWDKPSIVISNFRKCMLIHPEQDRGLSVREAARLQTFPDNYIFFGPLGYQQQQVANAVPPLLAKIIGNNIKNTEV